MHGRHLNLWVVPLCILIAFVIGCWTIVSSVVSRWFVFDESYSHGLLLAGVSVYLLVLAYRDRPPVPGMYPVWLIPFLLCVVVYVIGGLLLLEALQLIAIIPMLMAALAVVWGWRQLVPFIIPVGVLVFAVPFWDYLAWPLQILTVFVNDIWLGWLGIQFRVDGVFVYLTNIGAFEVAGGCSGLRYLLVGMSLSVIYGQLNYQLWRNRILLFVVSIAVGLLANWLRVFVIFEQGYATKMQSSLVHNHEFFGWILFGVMLIPLFWFANRLERGGSEQPAEAQATVALGSQLRFRVPVTIITILMLLSPGLTVSMLSASSTVPSELPSAPRLLSSNDWAPYYQRQAMGWKPVIKGADAIQNQLFFGRTDLVAGQSPKRLADVEIFTYLKQKPGKELVQDANRLYDMDLWSVDRTSSLMVQGRNWSLLSLKNRHSGQMVSVAFGYQVGGYWRDSALSAKLAQIPAALAGRHDAHLVVVALTCNGCDQRDEISRVVGEAQDPIIRFLASAYGQSGTIK